MINVIETPQQNDNLKINHVVDGDILNVTINGVTETFDFTGLPEGRMTEIIPDDLSVNPFVSAEKVGDIITIMLIIFYSEEEKGEFEFGENQMGS